jgi:hypothetical protein
MSSKVETSLDNSFARDLIRSRPVLSTFGLPVYVAASPAAPFSTTLGMTEHAYGSSNLDCSLENKFRRTGERDIAETSLDFLETDLKFIAASR